MDSPCIKQTVCKVLKIFQYGKYLVAYVLNILNNPAQIGNINILYFKRYWVKISDVLLSFTIVDILSNSADLGKMQPYA